MKIGLAGFGHETITFWPGVTRLEDFERVALYGKDIVEKRRGTNSAMGGFIDILEREGVEMVPICAAFGGATATVADEVYDQYVEYMRRGFAKNASELDGILLWMHGAMAAESRQDPETDAVREIREVVRYDIPIMVSFDLHANKDAAILEEADAIFGYHCSPHIDSGETGRRAARAILATLREEIKPTIVLKKPGIVVPSVYSATTVSPGKDIIDRVRYWEKQPGVVDVTALFGFAWADVHQLGMAMIAITDNDLKLAQEIVDDLCKLAWEKRKALTGREKFSLFSVEDGVSMALERAKTATKPIVILDHADRTNDTTFVLRELMRRGTRNVAHPVFYDPEAARACIEAGIGSTVELDVGASTGWRDGGKLHLRGKVLWTGEGKYIGTGPMRRNLEIDHGPTAIIDTDGVWLQFTTYKASLIDEDPITQFGYKTQSFDIIVTKSKTHFRAVYEKVGEEIVIVDAPGQCPADTSVFEYRNVPDGVYPITMN
ncbi:MAG: M81 family metallopeptidase [Candidatus Hodarchaeota archaeon]